MGCDIHIVTEIKQDNKWIGIEEIPETLSERNYSTFAFLANVRNSFGCKGFEAKGKPEIMSNKTKEMFDEQGEDGYSHSYLSLKELIEKDKSDYCSVKCKILKDFYDKFIELGGVIPEGMTIEEDKPQGIIDCFRFAVEPTVLVKWKSAKDKIRKYPLFKGIEELKAIANKYNIENYNDIRIVFCFDN